ncbi:hypothetical protein WJ0W_000317 [Paenibacillus melissococcoides]|uniref:LiaF transmembrane domain-containing protein n=1 Tax=Paenibacillus melissococcoides TaxID=2912268 RepID=A0ABM9FVB7_9BACL|nr:MULTISPECIES: hypothetical protein [Paenibacillus]MEB9894361.1 hypothetical protein [Bacillus cereus]CAH8243090.1 hypothetical protein WJ0W_000317 [Paenibacillus melissococcoides]CAH8703730.1 hypothetical protein WDD9_000311 [Paenibacillus melissococcoides]CAH8706756.1 hypothetical protein HTL2_001395 [Paenibacillus melissococcoides]GIO77294.1 hypothetical protein J6TS7_09040 [Paenibacillus dendritiformis]
MQMKKGNSFAIILIALGAFILLSKFGVHLGSWFGYLFPILLIVLGYYGVKAGNSFFGWIFIILGSITLIGKLFWLIGIFIAIGMIVFGISMLNNKRSGHHY